ncbi:unnamed protein product, partial [Meganyctiphanes norvegica]
MIGSSQGSVASGKLSIADNPEKSDGLLPKLPCLRWWGVRHTVVLLSFMGVFTSYNSRVSLSIGIVAMTGTEVYNASDTNIDLSDICPFPEQKYGHGHITKEDLIGEFDWGKKMQGLILGSFFYGYLASNIFFGWAADRFGPRLVLGTTVGLGSLLTILTPLCARSSEYLFIANRVLQGAAQGALYPGVVSMLASWATPQDREIFTSLIFAGGESGTLFALVLGGWLSESKVFGGWPSIFYLFGTLGLLWTILWFLLVHDGPDQDPKISQVELDYFQKHMGLEKKNEKKLPVPYLAMAKSPQIWVAICSSVGWHYGFYMLMAELPTYLKTTLHVDLMSVSVLLFLLSTFSRMWVSYYNFQNNKFLKFCNFRDFARLLPLCASGLAFAAMALVGCNATFSITVLCLAVGLGGAMYCSFPCSCIDLAPNFSGTIFGILNTVGAIVGILSPLITGAIIEGNPSLSAWRKAFFITSGILLTSGVITCSFLKAERQPWNEPKQDDAKERSTVSSI